MKLLATFLTAGMLLFMTCSSYAQTIIPVDHFHKVIVSPYIQVTFVHGDAESVTIDEIKVDTNKLHIETKGGTLRIYLEGAKEIPRNKKEDHGHTSHPLYHNHSVIATVTYRNLDALSLRGGETFLCQSPLHAEKFDLNIYGESTVVLTEAHFDELHTTMYGESSLDIKAGAINMQYYTCYGEGKVNTTSIQSQEAKLTAYGESEFAMNVSDRIKISAFGEAKLRYKGSAEIVKGIHIGDMDVKKIE